MKVVFPPTGNIARPMLIATVLLSALIWAAAATRGQLTISLIAQSGSNLELAGSGGLPGVTYYVIASTNLGAPLALGQRLSTNVFSPSGLFTNNIPIDPSAPQELMVVATTLPAYRPGLVAAYSFDEGTGNTVTDLSGNGNNGTIGTATWTLSGKYGGALSFDGVSSAVTINDSASLDLTTGMTLEAWVNPAGANTLWSDVIYKGLNGIDNYYLEASSPNNGWPGGGGMFGNTDLPEYATNDVLPAQEWSHVALTYDGSLLQFYFNGALVSSVAQTGNILTSSGPLQIGGDSANGQFFAGEIDEARVYNFALTPAQIQGDMATPVGDTPTAPANLAATLVSGSEVYLSWSPSAAELGIGAYLVEREANGDTNFVQIGWSTGTDYTDSTAVAGSNFSYRVRAVDRAGDYGPYSSVAQAAAIPIIPRAVALTPTEQQQFVLGMFTNLPAIWSVDGVVGGSIASGTISATGLYSPPGTAGTHTVTATPSGAFSVTAGATVYVTTNPGIFTHHNDNFRTGQNTNETVLTPATVNQATFGKLFSYPIDGISFASPLYVAGVNVPGSGFHNLVFVETEHDSVYAFDADGLTNTPVWHDSFINPDAGITPIPAPDTTESYDIPDEVGITGTPVIDPVTGTLYVVAATQEISTDATNYVQRLHALDISDGTEKLGGPVVIQASVTGTGLGSQDGMVSFDPLLNNQRAALLLASNVVYVAFGIHGNPDT
ncbi:MAG TPA: LamG-like jellyroll fold domain-containing protein, partial [Verrucomicrobiae bacterium]|nr:LamG-like jellyroll fold domain-containing protein [Verrucomicrobiae bacterium]